VSASVTGWSSSCRRACRRRRSTLTLRPRARPRRVSTTPPDACSYRCGGGGYGAVAVYSTHSTSLGSLGGQVFTGSLVAIASSGAGVDGGRFNLVGSNLAALNGTFLSFSSTNNTCTYEATAITDSGASGSSFTARTARTIVPVAPCWGTRPKGPLAVSLGSS
jgi:hypothetical protein